MLLYQRSSEPAITPDLHRRAAPVLNPYDLYKHSRPLRKVLQRSRRTADPLRVYFTTRK